MRTASLCKKNCQIKIMFMRVVGKLMLFQVDVKVVGIKMIAGIFLMKVENSIYGEDLWHDQM